MIFFPIFRPHSCDARIYCMRPSPRLERAEGRKEHPIALKSNKSDLNIVTSSHLVSLVLRSPSFNTNLCPVSLRYVLQYNNNFKIIWNIVIEHYLYNKLYRKAYIKRELLQIQNNASLRSSSHHPNPFSPRPLRLSPDQLSD